MKNHGLWMIIGCILPLFLIFLLPAFGVSGNVSLFIFIILMFACHLFMMGHHHGKEGNHTQGGSEEVGSKPTKETKHGCH